jgi:hypothetical protein
MTYTKELEALDRKWGRTVTVDDYRRLSEKSAAAIDDDDLTIIENFAGPQAAAAARARRMLALNPPPPDPPVAKTAAAPARDPVEFPKRLWKRDAPDLRKAIEEWAETHAMKAVPVGLWHNFVKGARENRETLEAKVATLEQRVAALEGTSSTSHGETLKPRVKFWGPWHPERLYQPNDAVNHDGTLLICHAAHVSTAFDADQVCWQRP